MIEPKVGAVLLPPRSEPTSKNAEVIARLSGQMILRLKNDADYAILLKALNREPI